MIILWGKLLGLDDEFYLNLKDKKIEGHGI